SAPAFLVPVAVHGRDALSAPRKLIFAGAAYALVAAAFIIWQELQDRYYNRAAFLASVDAEPSSEAAAHIPSTVSEDGAAPAGLVERLLEPIRLPDLPVLSALHDAAPWAAIGIVAAALLVAAGILVAGRRLGLGERLLLGAIALCCALQLFNVALLGAIVLAFTKRRGLAAVRAPGVVAAASMIVVGFIAWLSLALGLDL